MLVACTKNNDKAQAPHGGDDDDNGYDDYDDYDDDDDDDDDDEREARRTMTRLAVASPTWR